MSDVKRALEGAWREGAAYDLDLARAVRSAAKGFSGTRLRKAAQDGVSAGLILWLLSEKPLGRGERVMLAELLAGELNTTGRPASGSIARRAYRGLVDDIRAKRRELRAQGCSAPDAMEKAVEWGARDPRARGKAPSTIIRDISRRVGRL